VWAVEARPGRKYDVITFGDLCVDLIMSGDDVTLQFGQVEKLVGDYVVEMGGSCSLFACQASKLGLRVGILGRVGDDAFGHLVLSRLDDAGVDTSAVAVDPALKTGLGIAFCNGDDRAILTYVGSINALSPADVTDAYLASTRHLHYGSFFLHSGLIVHAPEIVRRARSHGVSVSLDTNWDPRERWNSTLHEVLPLIDVLMPNEPEARFIGGKEDSESAVKALQDCGVPIVALKLGTAGAKVYTEKDTFVCTVAHAEGGDSVGAGDSFDAGFLAGWLRGLPIGLCLEIACECGRSVANAAGGLAGQPTWEHVCRILDIT
jgi:sugar/nucleoside kinase (ribokinase family)